LARLDLSSFFSVDPELLDRSSPGIQGNDSGDCSSSLLIPAFAIRTRPLDVGVACIRFVLEDLSDRIVGPVSALAIRSRDLPGRQVLGELPLTHVLIEILSKEPLDYLGFLLILD